MKTILVPVDFSEHSENALKVAAQIAKKQEAEIVVVHMMGLSESNLIKENTTMEGVFFLKLTQKRFAEFLDKDYLEDITIHTTVKNYKIFSELEDVAIEYKAEMIIMGSHGSSGIQEVFVGSNTEKVVRNSKIPVLVIKDADSFSPSKAVFACDYKTESIPAFKKAMDIFKWLNVEAKLVFVNQPGEQYLSTSEIDLRLLEFIVQLKEYDLKPEDILVYSDFSVEKGVFNYAAKIKADLISIPTHGRRGLAHFFSGSIGEDIVNHSKLPVLTVKI